MGKRPRIKIKPSKTDYFLEVAGLIGLVCLFALTAYFYPDLPEEIPRHFNVYGQPDAFGKKEFIWVLPAVGLILYTGLTLLTRIPFAFNYPVSVTEENAKRLYAIGIQTIRILKAIVMLLFAFLNFKTIEIALSREADIGIFSLPVFLTALTVLIGIMIYKMLKSK